MLGSRNTCFLVWTDSAEIERVMAASFSDSMWKVIAINNYWTDEHKINLSEDEYSWIKAIASRVQSNFVTVDIARKENGGLIIMEFGRDRCRGCSS